METAIQTKKGLYKKFHVERTDGRLAADLRHELEQAALDRLRKLRTR